MTSAPSPAPAVLAGVLETAAVDESVRAQDDLFRHVNGAWLARAEIPADRPSTGSFTVLRDAAEEACRAILDELSAEIPADAGPPTTPRGKIAALYAAFMDAGRIEALGASPLEAELAPLLGATDKEALARAIGAGIATGFSGVIRVDVENDLNDPDHYTTWVGQAGLGLPDESYYRQEARAGAGTTSRTSPAWRSRPGCRPAWGRRRRTWPNGSWRSRPPWPPATGTG